MSAGGWREVKREVARYAAYRRYARGFRGRWRRDPMEELPLTERERTTAYLIALGLCGAVFAISVGLVYLVAFTLTLIYRSEFWDALLTAAGLFMIFLWPSPSSFSSLSPPPRVWRGGLLERSSWSDVQLQGGHGA